MSDLQELTIVVRVYIILLLLHHTDSYIIIYSMKLVIKPFVTKTGPVLVTNGFTNFIEIQILHNSLHMNWDANTRDPFY